VKSGTAAWQLAFAKADWGGAQLTITGTILSVTVKVVVQVAELLAASLTVMVTVVTPVETRVPAAGDWVITREAEAVQLSVAVT